MSETITTLHDSDILESLKTYTFPVDITADMLDLRENDDTNIIVI